MTRLFDPFAGPDPYAALYQGQRALSPYAAPSPYATGPEGPPDPQAKDDESLLKRLGAPLISGLGYVGNFLDLPGSMVRDTLASISGKPTNPFDQLLHPFSHNERGLSTSGRQLLTQWGVAPNKETGIRGWFDDPMEAVRDLGGFGVDVATDPLTYATFGARALGKGGEVMHAAGAPKLNALNRMKTTVAEMDAQLKMLGKSDDVLDAIKAAGYTNKAEFMAKHGDEAMGGLMKMHVPFTKIGTPLGSVAREAPRELRGDLLGAFDSAEAADMPKEIFRKTVAHRIAEGSARAGKAIRYGNVYGTEFSPGQQLARLFSAGQGGIQGAEIGKRVGGKTYATAIAIRENVRGSAARAASELKAADLLNDEGSALTTQFMEGVLDPASMSHETKAKALTVSKIMQPFRDVLDQSFEAARRNGTPLEHIADPTLLQHVPREAVDMLKKYVAGFGRERYTQGIWGGTEKLRQMIADPEISDPDISFGLAFDKFNAKYGDDVMIREGDQHARKALVQHIREGYTPEQRAVGLYGRHRLLDIQDGIISTQIAIEKTNNLNETLAKMLKHPDQIKGEKGVPAWKVFRETGIEPGMKEPDLLPVEPIEKGTQAPGHLPGSPAAEGVSTGDTLLDIQLKGQLKKELSGESRGSGHFAAQPGGGIGQGPVTPRLLEDMGEIPISEGNVSLKGNPRQGALWDIARRMDESGRFRQLGLTWDVDGMNTLGNLMVPEHVFDDLVRVIKGDDIKTTAGNLMQISEQMQTLFKLGVLNMPARPMRDFFSGQIHSMITGNWSWDAFKKGMTLVRGGDVDFTHVPLIQRMMKEQGLEPTIKNSTEMFRQLAYTHELYGAGSHGAGEMLHGTAWERAEAAGSTGPTLPMGTKQAAPTPIPPRAIEAINKDIASMWEVPREQWTKDMTAKRKTLLAEKNRALGTTDAKFIPDTPAAAAPAEKVIPPIARAPLPSEAGKGANIRPEDLLEPHPQLLSPDDYEQELQHVESMLEGGARPKLSPHVPLPETPPPTYLPTRSKDFAASFLGADPHDPMHPSTFLAGSTWNPTKLRGIGKELDTKNYYAATFERINTFTDAMNRLVPFIHNFEKGTSASRASEIVKAIQVYYAPHSFSNFERGVLKRAFPFYSFTSRMTKHVVEELASRPGGGLAQIIRAQHEASATDLPMPAYVGQTGAIPFGTLDDGTKRYLTGLGLMHEDPVQLLGGGLGGAALEVLSRTSPLPKSLAELATGESFFQRGQLGGGREITEQDPPLGRLLTNLGLRSEVGGKATPVLGTAFEHLLANSPLTRVISTARTLTDPRKRIPGTVLPGVSLLPALTGARITDVSEGAQDVAISQAADQLAKETLDARRFETTYIPKDVREAAKLKSPTVAARIEDYNQIKSNLRKRSDARAAREEKAKQAAKAMQAATSP